VFQWVQEGGVDLILSMWYKPAVQEIPRLPRQHYVVIDWRLNVVNYVKGQKKILVKTKCSSLRKPGQCVEEW
jgi:hypothetical protein